MNARRDGRNNRVALFDGIEEGGIRASSLYSTSSHDNDQALDGLQDRVNLLKRAFVIGGLIQDQSPCLPMIMAYLGV
ncbi:hypothetical protein ACSQ67_014653 [Phaseolus vulgaris]